MTEAEYLAFERASEEKHKFLDGHVYAMAGASMNHGLIVGDTFGSLRQQLRGGSCRAIANDLRVSVVASRLNTYPDIVAICGEPRLTDDQLDTLLNPTVLIEVLSPSTASHDRGTSSRSDR